MKIKLWAIALFLGAASGGQAQVLLSVDFNGLYYSDTQSGFTGLYVPQQNSYSTTLSGYSFDFLGAGGSNANAWHDEAVPGGTYQPFYKDFLDVNGWNGYTITLGGLSANTTYSLTLWFSDNTGYDLNGSVVGTYGSFTMPSSTNLTDNIFTTDITTDSFGQIVGTFTPVGYGNGGLAGFEISANAVPEPSTIASMGLGLAFLALRLRRRS
jgi:hypothetical protein